MNETAQNVEKVEALIDDLNAVRAEIGKVIFGQEEVVEETLITLLAGGHLLLVGVPGLAKTKLVETLSTVLGMSQKRVQFTPDLMPSDIIGAEVLDQDASGGRQLRFIKGPVFARLLMADEINRASPRTQAALLQAMQEKTVTVGGVDHPLPKPFHVLATQNPLEQEGTYPLPEAQLDRFLLQINVRYPSIEAERRMMVVTTADAEQKPSPVIDSELLIDMQAMIRKVPVGDKVVDAILTLVRSGRPGESEVDGINELVAWGPGPRASQALMLACRVRALLHGRTAPSIADVKALAGPVLRHRMAPTFVARADGVDVDTIIERLTARL